MTIEVLKDHFSVVKLKKLPRALAEQPFVFTGRTDRELSVVFPTEIVPAGTTAREDGWRGFRIAGQLDFSLVGILARISSVLAEAQVGIFAVSTYDTDYIFVKEQQLGTALNTLKQAGFFLESL